PNQSPEKETPQNTSQGKQRASNYQKITPKSHATPKEAPNPFKSYKEYASKRNEGDINPQQQLGKTQVSRDGLSFEMLKFERQ
ncbi:hypothetical protein VP01_12891g1, partial [Puccinia sorghi]